MTRGTSSLQMLHSYQSLGEIRNHRACGFWSLAHTFPAMEVRRQHTCLGISDIGLIQSDIALVRRQYACLRIKTRKRSERSTVP